MAISGPGLVDGRCTRRNRNESSVAGGQLSVKMTSTALPPLILRHPRSSEEPATDNRQLITDLVGRTLAVSPSPRRRSRLPSAAR